MISIYSIPATLGLVVKCVILYLSQRAKVQNLKTRLFTLAVIFSVALGLVEAVGFNYGFGAYRNEFGFAYFMALIPLVAILAHLSILIAFERPLFYVPLFIYGYVLLLEILLFTPLLIVRFDPFLGYTITRVPGPLYGLFEIFALLSVVMILIVPIFGLRADRSALMRSQCKLWTAAAAPLVVVAVAIVYMLHFQIQLFNSTVTLPLLFTLLLAAIGYAVHNRRIIELDFYIPWSRTRKYKKKLYAHLDTLTGELDELGSMQQIVDKLFFVLRCPLVLISPTEPISSQTGTEEAMRGFPLEELRKIGRTLTVDEAEDTLPGIAGLMKEHKLGAIVPFYPLSHYVASWLLLGEVFGNHIYTPQDFRVVERLFNKLGALLLDELSVAGKGLNTSEQQNPQEEIPQPDQRLPGLEKFVDNSIRSLNRSLDEHLSEIEALFISQALKHSQGNKAKAARLLGLRANTLYYKMERYGLLTKKGTPE